MDYKLVLASNSPRRKELLAGLGVPFEVRVLQDIDEDYPESLPVNEVARYIAKEKADAYRRVIAQDELIITADTVVTETAQWAHPSGDHRCLSAHSREGALFRRDDRCHFQDAH